MVKSCRKKKYVIVIIMVKLMLRNMITFSWRLNLRRQIGLEGRGKVLQDQDTRLRMPNKWNICKEGKAGNKKDNCLCFLNYLAFLQPAADRAVSILPWFVSPGRSYGFLFTGSIIQKK
jgi:hypothetical protein